MEHVAGGGRGLAEVRQLRIGGLGALMRGGSSASRPPCAALLCPGHPLSSDASMPLVSAVEKAFGNAHVPVLRFDYAGVGLSASSASSTPGRSKRSTDLASCVQDARKIIAWTRDHIASVVIACGYSWGSAVACELAAAGDVQAMASISIGCDLHRYGAGDWSSKLVHAVADGHSSLTCSALYVVGDQDTASPIERLLELVSNRSDGGEGVSIEVIEGGAHDLWGRESEVAGAVGEWFKGLLEAELTEPRQQGEWEDLAAAHGTDLCNFDDVLDTDVELMFDLEGAIMGAIDLDGTVRGPCAASGCSCFRPPSGNLARKLLETCLSCGRKNTDHDDRGASRSDDDLNNVRVDCKRATNRNVARKSFHISLPYGAKVADLRKALGSGLLTSAQILRTQPGLGMAPLKDVDVVPEVVTISEFVGEITPSMVLTRAQCKWVFGSLKAAAQSGNVQKRLDMMKQQHSSSAYTNVLNAYLIDELYPLLFNDFFGAGQGLDPFTFSTAVVSHGSKDEDILEQWLEVATIFGDSKQIEKAEAAISAFVEFA